MLIKPTLVVLMTSSLAYAADPGAFEVPGPNPLLYDRVEIFEDPQKPKDSWFARAVVTNVTGLYNEVETENTSRGLVAIQYETSIPNKANDPNSADTACVVSLPDGVIAIPECVDILEEETETIFLYDYLGG